MLAVWLFVVKHWRWIAYAVAAAVVVWFLLLVRHWRTDSVVELPKAEAALKLEVECADGSECAKRYSTYQAEGVAAVIAARQAAAQAASEAQAKLEADAQASVARAEAAASVARTRQREAEARLRVSIASDESCAAQSRETIKCDY